MDIKRITSGLLGFPLVLAVLLIGNKIVVDIALDTESLEPVVIYRALYGDNKLWTRPLNEFVSLVPDKYKNEYKQECRFEVIDMDEINE